MIQSASECGEVEIEELFMPEGPVAISVALIAMAREGRFAEIRDMFAPQLQILVSADALRIGWSGELDRLGPITHVGEPSSDPLQAGVTTVRVPVTCERGGVVVVVSINEAGSLTGVQLVPGGAVIATEEWTAPAYVDGALFAEQDVTLGSGPLAVSGTLSVPVRPGRLSAVVLLGGSGPNDRDETIGRNKPFKDLAWGLASQGVVVLRFDKVTFAHRNELANVLEFTLEDEYLPDAGLAIELLRHHDAVDPERVFLIGHSLGGTVAPRVAASDSSLAGVVLLAGGAQPMHWAIVRQVSYLASLNPATAEASRSTIDTLREQAARVDDPNLSVLTPASELPFGVAASYWLDLRNYDPVTTAASLPMPILVLQGGRDYQATVADDFSRWQSGLSHRSDVTFQVYEDDNHFFFSGDGLSSPADYEAIQHVDARVVADVGRWLTGNVRR
jgi:dienelactone hydrolase